MPTTSRLFQGALLLLLGGCLISATTLLWGQQEHVIYNFRLASGGLPQGISPASKLVADGNGNFFGTTYSGGPHYCGFEGAYDAPCGTVFKLSPSTAGGWTSTVLYNFGSAARDGAFPQAELLPEGAGGFYGTNTLDGDKFENDNCTVGCGTVFHLIPPSQAGDAWTETVIYRFLGFADGSYPQGRLVLGDLGSVYGVTAASGSGPGVIFELTPPAITGDTWAEGVIYRFPNPSTLRGGLTRDETGNLYGSNGNEIFELIAPAVSGGPWTKTTLYTLHGWSDGSGIQSDLTFDGKGNLYGTTLDGGGSNGARGEGTVFELSPPPIVGEVWNETVLHRFLGGSDGVIPTGGVTLDSQGRVYGVTFYGGLVTSTCPYGCGILYRLDSDGGAWNESIVYRFHGVGGGFMDGYYPEAGVVFDSDGNLYGTTGLGGSAKT